MSTAWVEKQNARLRGPLLQALTAAGLKLDADELMEVVANSLNARLSAAALAPAMTKTPMPVLPGFARGLQATENVWRQIEHEFGLVSSTVVSQRIGSRSPNRALASKLRESGKLLAVKRMNAYLFPGFQFRQPDGIHPAIPQLITVSRQLGWPEEEVILWLCAPSGYFEGDRPVDHLDDGEFLEKARASATVEW